MFADFNRFVRSGAAKPTQKRGAHINIVMSNIKITNEKELDGGWEFVVQTPAGSEHTVTVNEDYYRELTGGETTPEELVRKSFAFLLDNEPASAILSEFNLSDIEGYFPHFQEELPNY